MEYRCPSCFLKWKDAQEPMELKCEPLCSFCSLKHTQKELLNWQADHIENLETSKICLVIKHMYRYFELELTKLKEEVHEKRNEGKKE